MRYKKHSLHGLFRYVQVFVVSNGDRDLAFSHTFFWSDKENKRISQLKDFAHTFLEKSFIAKIISRYMIVNDTDKLLMVMRLLLS